MIFGGRDHSAHGLKITFSFLLERFSFVNRGANTTLVVIGRQCRIPVFCKLIANLFEKKALAPTRTATLIRPVHP